MKPTINFAPVFEFVALLLATCPTLTPADLLARVADTFPQADPDDTRWVLEVEFPDVFPHVTNPVKV